ncbi:hypothetical protein KC19_12G168400 [Ceratodon purpureus]|uniref:MLO-like protein n=1 Tax=Ceratodon purpureus TaxID=3225 RepID=A0A8T0G8P6_CERPU|nr:hypothetical protein KC19_12G168400 [Ceratodon purpureus]
MTGGGGELEKSLEQTPTWAVALVCTVFVVASLLVERGLHSLGQYFKRSNKRELYHTLEVIKNELMLLGFISLFLTVFQPKVAALCMPEKLNRSMLPCPYVPLNQETSTSTEAAAPAAHRRLFTTEEEPPSSSSCSAGHVQVISVEGLHQLHIFIFVMAVIHVCYSCLTVLVGLWQVHSWKKWEVEAINEGGTTVDEALNPKHIKLDPGQKFAEGRIRYEFLRTSRTGLNLDSYVYSFFRQFGRPIYKADYLCLRAGFIATHQLKADYNFHSYIRRTMEEDFKQVVGISAYLWAFVCLFLLLDIHGWYTYFWIAFIPTVLVLIVGTKLQQIIIDLALEVRGGVKKIDILSMDNVNNEVKAEKRKVVFQPMRPRDDLFWFKKPHVLVHLVHFILFQNAFELAFFFWAMFEYGFSSCLLGRTWMIIVRLLMGVFVQVLCSASTLPLYALVSQMGSTIRFTIFGSKNAQSSIHRWRAKAAKRAHAKKAGHVPLAHHLGGIVGLNKSVDEQGHVHNMELRDGGALYSKDHSHPQDDSITVEIRHETPLTSSRITEDSLPVSSIPSTAPNARDQDYEPACPADPKKLSLSNIYKLMHEKEKGPGPELSADTS